MFCVVYTYLDNLARWEVFFNTHLIKPDSHALCDVIRIYERLMGVKPGMLRLKFNSLLK